MEQPPQRKWLRHDVPAHIPDRHPTFFITICCQEQSTNQLANENV